MSICYRQVLTILPHPTLSVGVITNVNLLQAGATYIATPYLISSNVSHGVITNVDLLKAGATCIAKP